MSSTDLSPEETADAVERHFNALELGEAQLFLLIDASQSEEIWVMVEALCKDALCLFDGSAYDDLKEVAPWLVPVTPGDDVFNWFLSDGWGQDWGIFLSSAAKPTRLKTSLKRSIMVQDEDNRELYFKFYRPNVFSNYVPAFTPEQAVYLMRDIDTVWTEALDQPGTLLAFKIQDNALAQDEVPLALPAPA